MRIDDEFNTLIEWGEEENQPDFVEFVKLVREAYTEKKPCRQATALPAINPPHPVRFAITGSCRCLQPLQRSVRSKTPASFSSMHNRIHNAIPA